MKFIAAVLCASPLLAVRIPGGGSSSPTSHSSATAGSAGATVVDAAKFASLLDPLLLGAISGLDSGKCKVADYTITGCGVKTLTLEQGITFCFKNVNYLYLCSTADPSKNVPYCFSPSYGADILAFAKSGSLSSQCSVTPPYYGAFTTNF